MDESDFKIKKAILGPGPEEDEGRYKEEVLKMSEADSQLCTDLVILLEDELDLDLKRIQVMVRGGVVYLQ